MKYTITAFVENTPGVLNRMSDMFTRRKINIESLTVSETEQPEISRFTVLVNESKDKIEKVVKQLYKIIEVVRVYENTDEHLIAKEIALIKVYTKTPDERRTVEDIATIFDAHIAHVGNDYLILEKSGHENEIRSLFLMLKPHGVQEFVQSGRIAVQKEKNTDDPKITNDIVQKIKDTSRIVDGIEVSAIKRLQLMAAQDENIISLAQGIPSFDTPKNIREAAKVAIDKGLCDRYTAGYGIEPLRQALRDKVKRDNHIEAQASQIIVTHGAIEAMIITFIGILNPRDEIIFISPDYASHITQAVIAHYGARPIYVPLEEDKDWKLDPSKLEGAVNQHTKAILICNPSNPVGKVFTKKELESLVEIAKRYNLYIISDETYEYFTFDGSRHISVASLPGAAEHCISIFSLSKTYSMTGWRIGYSVTTQAVANQLFKVHDSLVTCPTAVSQYAALEAIEGPQNAVDEFRSIYIRRRQIVIDALKKTNKLKLVTPQGGYFAFIKVENDIDDYELAIDLVKHAAVAVVPGSAFGLGGEHHIRVSFGCEDENLIEGMKRLIAYVNKTL